MKHSGWVDILATLTALFALLFGGYLWMEQKKEAMHSDDIRNFSYQNNSFEHRNKTTE